MNLPSSSATPAWAYGFKWTFDENNPHSCKPLVSWRAFDTCRCRDNLRDVEGLDWITALRNNSIKKLIEENTIQLSLFDERDLAEVTSATIRASG